MTTGQADGSFHCLYCDKNKSTQQLSREHIIPKAIAGNLTPQNPLVLRTVCSCCNNLSGLFIDGPFIRSYFTNNSRAQNASKFLKLSDDTILPLVCFGQSKDIKRFCRICDFWLGPTGDSIFHFHKPYPTHPKQSPIVGVPPESFKKKIDHGFVFLFVVSNNPEWHPIIINSFIGNFEKSKLYLGNGPKPTPRFSDIPITLRLMQKKLKNKLMKGEFQKTQFTMAVDYGNRFLAKISLGLGAILLDNSFATSVSANLLREFMWAKEYQKRQLLPVRGTGFLGEIGGLGQNNQLTWDGGHVIALMNLPSEIALYANFYEVHSGLMLVSDDKSHWKNPAIEGLVFVIVPGLGRVVGPLDIAEFLNHKLDPNYSNQELASLEIEMKKCSTLPPFHI